MAPSVSTTPVAVVAGEGQCIGDHISLRTGASTQTLLVVDPTLVIDLATIFENKQPRLCPVLRYDLVGARALIVELNGTNQARSVVTVDESAATLTITYPGVTATYSFGVTAVTATGANTTKNFSLTFTGDSAALKEAAIPPPELEGYPAGHAFTANVLVRGID